VRVSVLPTFYGENIVLRLLRPDLRRGQKLKDLGLSEEQAQIIEKYIVREQGMIIIAGPTGSGKTTTIYSIISSLLSRDKNIVTIEDPIEYVIPGVRQIQVSEQSDFGFAKALRAILRQDPDIIVLGEIRDSETAHLAFQASLTGHLVITTIHAEDSAGVYGRLHDLGITREMMHSLSLFISQRLIKIKDKKRVGVFEVIPVEGKTKVTLFQNTYPEYIRAALKKQGVLLLEDSIHNAYLYVHQVEKTDIESI
jgi:type II secretory ATPase GspE/PulE/Tfp pilus assembly ATPase PilB-like protein